MSEFPLIILDSAFDAAKQALDFKADQNSFIRVAIQGGGCSGLQYKLDFETEQREDDYIYEKAGLKIVIDGFSAVYLQGTQLEYVSSLTTAGFQFVNPNAKKTCGCGSSFGV